MPSIPVLNVLQANIRFTLDAQQIENVLNFIYPVDDFEGAADSVYSTLNDVWWAAIRTYLSDAVFSNETYIVDLNDINGAVATKQPFTPNRGANGNYGVPNNSAFVITHRTASRGKSYRGRTYISGIATPNIEGNYITQGAADALVGAFNSMRTALAADNVLFCIVSRQQGGDKLTVGQSTPVQLSVARDRVMDSQRRRSPGRGR